MASTRDFLRNLKLSNAEKAQMTPEQAAFAELRDIEVVTVKNRDRFDAKGMVPVDFPEGKLIPWTIVDDGAEGGDEPK